MKDEKLEETLGELLDLIEQDIAIQEYKEVEALVKNSPELSCFQKELKNYQKKAVLADFYGHSELSASSGKVADEKLGELARFTLVQEYQEKMAAANDLLQHVTKLLENFLEGSFRE